MKMNEREDTARACAVLIAAGVVGLNYLRIARAEKKKRAKIEEWRLENLACIENSRERLVKMATDPNISIGEFWTTFQEDQKFNAIVRNQPMY